MNLMNSISAMVICSTNSELEQTKHGTELVFAEPFVKAKRQIVCSQPSRE